MLKRYRKWRDRTTGRVGRFTNGDAFRITYNRKGFIVGVEVWNKMPGEEGFPRYDYNCFDGRISIKRRGLRGGKHRA